MSNGAFSIHIGMVGHAHGLNGATKVRLFDASSDVLVHAKQLFVVLSGVRSPVVNRACSFRLLRPAGGAQVILLEGCTSRDDAEALQGAEVWVDPADLPPLDANEFYLTDLVGYEAYSGAEPVGRITEIQHLAGQSFFVIDGVRVKGALVPAMLPFLQHIDPQLKTMTLDVPEGFWELYI